jgi:very-short-patch-repair endonuclease
VAHLDALARATGVQPDDALVLMERYPKARGLPSAAKVLPLLDAGGHSPRETALRLLLIDGGLPRPRTQIRVSDGADEAFIDMGYDEPKVGLEYEGAHHATDRRQYVYDIGREAFVTRQGWLDLRVVAEHSRAYILHRVREALKLRSWL